MGNKSTKKDKIEKIKDEEKIDIIDNEKIEETDDKETKVDDTSKNELQDEDSNKDNKIIKDLETKLEESDKKKDEYFHLLQLKAAEFENFRKRTVKEKDELYKRAFVEAIELFLPLIDNFDRAIIAMSKEDSSKESVREGVEMVYKQLSELLKNVGVEEIKTVGETFDPQYHNAMMHIEDENYDANVIIEEFQKGFIYKGKVVRHSAVKVAN